RDDVAALGPPARLGGGASLVDEWRALTAWTERESQARSTESARQAEVAMTAAAQRAERLGELGERCRADGVDLPSGADPAGAAREVLGRASADHQRLVEQAATAEQLRNEQATVEAPRVVARLESIFLDEGFGTLDADTLDVVASAIEELGASGRLVGVVSHVADLAERLPVRFEVRRAGNASTIERVDR